MSTIDPLVQFRRWFRAAQRTGMPLPEAMALATADAKGRPSVRFILLKDCDEHGFVFYGNAVSRKGRELRANPRASVAFYWDPTKRQVRVEGGIEEVTAEEADAYWATRPRDSCLAAVASRQSALLSDHAALTVRWRRLRRRYEGRDVPRPHGWTGFRIIPDAIEFWTLREHRLHDRELFTRTRSGWRRQLLQP